MQNEFITYEQPLNERIRTFLRLDHLFRQTLFSLRGESVWESRHALGSIVDILNIFDRADLKSEAIKELERHTASLVRLEQSPGIDRGKLHSILDEIGGLLDAIYGMNGRVGQRLRDNEFITMVRQRSAIPGGTCDFDLPLYHQWLERTAQDRIHDLDSWLAEFEPMRLSIDLVLKLIRQSAAPVDAMAVGGFYQKALDPNVPFQMVRIRLAGNPFVFPEMSAGKHRFTVRFLRATLDQRPVQAEEDIPFQLSCCLL